MEDRLDGHRIPDGTVEATTDPVCGMTVADSTRRFSHGGRTFLFCGDGCLRRFREDPELFLKSRAPSGEKDNAP